MKNQMFPPNQIDNSFDWFRNQNQLHDNTFNFHENNQFQNEMSRYYGNVIQPFPQNPTQSQIQPAHTIQPPQSVQMMESSPYGNPTSTMGQQVEGQITNGGEGGTMMSNPYEFYPGQQMSYQAPQTSQFQNYPTYSFNPQTEGISGYGQNGVMQNQNPYYQMGPTNPGTHSNYQGAPVPTYQGYPGHPQAQMMQGGQPGSGPFSAPAMFAPSTPYPTQPKQLNQQSSNTQSFQISSLLNQFKNSSGSYDVPKMMSTAGQMMNTMNQVGGIFKQIGVFFK